MLTDIENKSFSCMLMNLAKRYELMGNGKTKRNVLKKNKPFLTLDTYYSWDSCNIVVGFAHKTFIS